MAEKTNKIVCCICLGDFTNPKLIDCHHCFCLKCLEGYVEKFTVGNNFPCPLCRREIAVPAGGVNDFATNFYITDSSHSTGDGQRNQELCDVCTDVNCNFKCADCDKLLCFSCKSTHDIFYASNNHNVEVLTKNGQIQTKPQILGDHSDSMPKDFCANHRSNKADFYCEDCSVVMCFRCCVEIHDGHQFVDLTGNQSPREELKTLKLKLKNQIARYKNFCDDAEVRVSEVADMADKICWQVDDQIKKIYDELKSLGEKTMVRVNNWRDEETDKLNATRKEIQIECEILGNIIDNSDDVLENKTLVQLIELLPDIRKEQAKQGKRKLDIPVQKYVKFVDGHLNSDILFQQVGHVEIFDRPPFEVGQTCCFTTSFNLCQVKLGDVTWQSADGDDIIPWSIGVYVGGYQRLYVDVKLDNITDETIQRVDVNHSHKLINNNDSQSVISKKYSSKISPGGRSGYGYRLIDNKTLNNKQTGFLSTNNNFKIETTITITSLW